MKPDLRDWFAAHVAAALAAEQRFGLETIAARAYDVADALLAERGRRMDAELAALQGDGFRDQPGAFASPLLDEAMPVEERDEELDPSWLDPAYDPAWDRGEGPLLEHGGDAQPRAATRPGLARTQLELPVDTRARKTSA